MYLKNKILNFPKTKNQKIQNAINNFGIETADTSLSQFISLIDNGCDEAYALVGAIYECGGKNVNQDYKKALFYYERSVETYGAVEAYLGLIRIYYYGLGVERDYCKAFEYCTILIEETDNMYANCIIGKMYMNGLCIENDSDKAKEYFTKAWEAGYVFGLTYLGLLEQKLGNTIRGWYLRIKAGYIAFMIGRENIDDHRIRKF